MKQLILFFFLLSSKLCIGQTDDIPKLPVGPEGSVQFQEVVAIDSTTSAKELISRARTWAGKAYKSANTVVQQYDAEAGVLVIKGLMQHTSYIEQKAMLVRTSTPITRNVEYTITIESKPGRYRTTMENLILQGSSIAGYSVPARPLPFRPNLPVNLSQANVSKTQMAAYKNSIDFYSEVQDYVRDTFADLKKAMQQAGKKDW